MRTECPICRTSFDVTEVLIGQTGRCSTCGAKFVIVVEEVLTRRPDGQTTQPMIPPTAPPSPAATGKFPVGLLLLASVIAALTAGALAWLILGTVPRALVPWVSFLGDMHPLFVHFPVGWVMAIFILGFFDSERHSAAMKTLLWFNLLTCAVSLVAGQACGMDRAHGVVLTRHLYAGFAVGIFSWLALLTFLARRPGGNPWPYRAAILGTVVSVTLAGHFGATLTHGELLDKAPWAQHPKESSKILSTTVPESERTVLGAVILPILQSRCVGCHGPDKQKGNLRLDSYDGMMAVGESEKHSFVAANPAESASLVRANLPLDDEDHMPPEKKPQLEPAELAVLEWWVLAGADAKLKLSGAPAPDAIKSQLQTLAANPPKAPAGN